MTLKRTALGLLRAAHVRFASKAMPDRVAIYFHELERHQRPAFDDAMRWFQDAGYRSVRPSEFVASGGSDRRLFVSFDDNFHHWFEAMDLFERRRIRATFYVTTAPLRDNAEPQDTARFFDRIRYRGEGRALSRQELCALHEAGHVIGCHTHTHPVLSRLSRDQWGVEIDGARRLLEDCIDAPVEHFSFPFGMRRHFSASLRRYCAGLGFKTIATGISGLQHCAPEAMSLHRTGWRFDLGLRENLVNLSLDARLYAALTGRSVVG